MNESSSWSSDHSDAALPLLERHLMASRPRSLPAGALGSRSILLQNGCRPSFALHQINEHVLLNEFFNTKELLRVVSFPTNPGSTMSVKFLIALRWKHYLLFRSPPKAASQRNFPNNFKWQKLALSAPVESGFSRRVGRLGAVCGFFLRFTSGRQLSRATGSCDVALRKNRAS